MESVFEKGQKESQAGQYRTAVADFEKIVKRTPDSDLGVEAAKEAARILFFEIKDFKRAVEFYKHIVLYSPASEERRASQRQIVVIYFDHMSDYPNSIIEVHRLLSMVEAPEEKMDLKIRLARSYFYQNNFQQAENEVDEFLRSDYPEKIKFEMKLLKGNINVAKKDLTRAVAIFRELMKASPKLASENNLGLTLSVTLEEMKDFKGAAEILQQIRSTHAMPEYIDIRVKRLKERMSNQPGAHGMRK
jgi:tetratricopeptide (TPR) repeat protein